MQQRFVIAVFACCGLMLLSANLLPAQEAAEPDDQPNPVAVPSAFENPIVMLARDAAVQRELKFTTQQAKAVAEAVAEVDLPLWLLRDVPRAKSEPRALELIEEFETRLAGVLRPAQQQRLEGIAFRARGWSSLEVAKTRERLELSAVQSARISTILAESRAATAASRKELAGEPASTLALRQKKQAEADQRRILEVLSPLQQQTLTHLVGDPFDLTQVRKAACHAPELAGIDTWINTPALSLGKLEGKVVAVHFWAFGCINCVRNLPWYEEWHEQFADQGLVIVGVHTPETARERDVDAVRQKVQQNKMAYPIAVDAQAETWKAWRNNMWPSVYLIDKQGKVRYWWYGELNWKGAGGQKYMAGRIEELLAEK